MDTTERIDALLSQWQECRRLGREVAAAELARDCPELVPELERQIDAQRQMERLAAGGQETASAGSGPSQPNPASASTLNVAEILKELGPLLGPPGTPGELGRLGGFRLLELLGAGGMGLVFAAEDTALNRRVALKIMRPAVAAKPGARQRFLREARAAAALHHDHVVPIYHIDEQNGVPFIAMPLLAGETLAARLKRDKRLPSPLVVQIGRGIASALVAAHAAGLIHRDIKPANIWLERPAAEAPDAPPRVKVLDFGLARPADGGEPLTELGTLLGTPAYMSPEQVDGLALDGRSDLFSLGSVLYATATGISAYRRPTLTATLRAVADFDPPPPHVACPDVPPALSAVIMRLLAKAPAQRPASATEVAAEFARMEAAAPSSIALPRGHDRRRRVVGVTLAGVAVAGTALAIWLTRPQGETGTGGGPPEPPEVKATADTSSASVMRRELQLVAGKVAELVQARDGTEVVLHLRDAEQPNATWLTEAERYLIDAVGRHGLHVVAAAPMRFGEPLPAQDALRREMAEVVKDIAKVLKTLNHDSISIGEFTGPPQLAASGGSAIVKTLGEELTGQGLTVRRAAPVGIKGEYRKVYYRQSGQNDLLGAEIKGAVTDRGGEVLFTFTRGVFGDTVVARLFGVKPRLMRFDLRLRGEPQSNGLLSLVVEGELIGPAEQHQVLFRQERAAAEIERQVERAVRPELHGLAQEVARVLSERGDRALAFGTFSGPRQSAGEAGRFLRRILAEELMDQGVRIQWSAEVGLQAEFYRIRGQESAAVGFRGVVTDRQGGVLSTVTRGCFHQDVLFPLLGSMPNLATTAGVR